MIQEIIDGLLGSVMNVLLNILMNFIIKPVFTLAYNLVLAIVSYYFYQVSVVFLSVIDLVSDLFRMVAGLAPGITFDGLHNYFAPGTIASDDMLIQFVTSKEVLGMFGSMLVVGVFLTIVSTMVANIKQELNLQKANKKGEVLGKMFRALFNLIFVPVIVIFGMFMGNMFLKLIDTATGGGDATISGRIFASAARGAFYKEGDIMKVYLTDPSTCAVSGSVNAVVNLMIEAINSIFGEDEKATEDSLTKGLNEATLNKYIYIDQHGSSGDWTDEYRVYYNTAAVSKDFNATRINYILIYFSSIAVIKCLLQASFGLVSRLYKGVALFVIMPGVIGISPMDDGNAYKSWKKEMVKQVIGAYGVIIAVNLYLQLMGIFSNISVNYVPTNAPNAAGSVSFSGLTTSTLALLITDNGFATAILQIVFIVCGALMLDKFSATISSLIGAENLASIGKGLFSDSTKSTTGAVKTGAKVGAAGLAMTYKGANSMIKGVGALSDKMQSRAAAKAALPGIRQGYIDSFKKKTLEDRQAYINKMISDQYGKKKAPKNDKERKQLEAKWGKNFDKGLGGLSLDEAAEKYADNRIASEQQAVKDRAAFEKSVKREARRGTGFLASGSRSFAMREVVDNAMKEYDKADKKPKKLADLGEDSKARSLMENASKKAENERSANMKVGVRLGKNALKQLLPGAKMLEEVKGGIEGKRNDLKNFSDIDASIVENFEKALQEGADEKAKKDFKDILDTAEMEAFRPILDNVNQGAINCKNALENELKELMDRARAYEDQGVSYNELIDDFIEKHQLDLIDLKGKSIGEIQSKIQADINVKYDLSQIQQTIKELKGSKNGKQVLTGMKNLISKYAGVPTIVKELEKALAQMKAGMK